MSWLTVFGNGIFGLFLLVAAWQDFRMKAVERRVYLGFGMAAVVWNLAVIVGVLAAPESGTEPWVRFFADGLAGLEAGDGWGGAGTLLRARAESMLPGAGLLVLSRVSRGSIGAGDGWFFLVSGLLLDASWNLALLCYAVMLCGLHCLGFLVYGRFRKQGNPGRQTVAFLPFVVLAEAGMLIGCLAAG